MASSIPSTDEDTLSAIEGHGVRSRNRKDSCLRVTASDVASARGCSIDSASADLAGLTALLSGASMEVTRQGQILYAFPKDSRRRWRAATASRPPTLARVRTRVRRAVENGVGWLLLGSVAALGPLAGSAEQFGLSSWSRAPQAGGGSDRRGAQCFSFLFGDGGADAAALEAAQWRLVARTIRENQGAVVAEQLLPHLVDVRARGGAAALQAARQRSPSRAAAAAAGAAVAPPSLQRLEPFMLPVLARFGGRPHVTDAGVVPPPPPPRARARARRRGSRAARARPIPAPPPSSLSLSLALALALFLSSLFSLCQVVYLFPELLPSAATPANYGLYPTHAPLVRGATALAKSLAGPDDATDYLSEPIIPFGGRCPTVSIPPTLPLAPPPPLTRARASDRGAARRDTRGVLGLALANLLGLTVLGALLGPWQLALRARAAPLWGGLRPALLLRLLNVAYGAALVNGALCALRPPSPPSPCCAP